MSRVATLSALPTTPIRSGWPVRANCVVNELLNGGIERDEVDAVVGDVRVSCEFDSLDPYHPTVCSSERDLDDCPALDFVVDGRLDACSGDG